MNGLSWATVYWHLSKHQFDVSRRITASFCEAPKISFLCIIEVILYTRMFIIDICWFYSTQSRLHRIVVLFWGVTLPHPSVHMYKVKLTSHLALEMHLWPNLNSNNTFYESQFCLVTVWFKNGPRIQVCKIRIYEIQFWGFSLSFLRWGKENSFFLLDLEFQMYILELLQG